MAYYKKIYNEKFGVWYPSAVVMGSPVSTKKLARRLSQMCTVTYADVMAARASPCASRAWAPSATR